jgi:nucleotide-binding universal stress UspA family protein
MYKTILVPLDGSERAEAILRHVEDLAKSWGAKVIFLQVVEPIPVAVGPDGLNPALDQAAFAEQLSMAESYLTRVEREFREKGINAKRRVACGTVVGQVLNVAKEEGVDLIAMASHGRSALSRVFYGSVAAGVLHSVDRPLLLIRSVGH